MGLISLSVSLAPVVMSAQDSCHADLSLTSRIYKSKIPSTYSFINQQTHAERGLYVMLLEEDTEYTGQAPEVGWAAEFAGWNPVIKLEHQGFPV